jgi:hypothetical protein
VAKSFKFLTGIKNPPNCLLTSRRCVGKWYVYYDQNWKSASQTTAASQSCKKTQFSGRDGLVIDNCVFGASTLLYFNGHFFISFNQKKRLAVKMMKMIFDDPPKFYYTPERRHIIFSASAAIVQREIIMNQDSPSSNKQRSGDRDESVAPVPDTPIIGNKRNQSNSLTVSNLQNSKNFQRSIINYLPHETPLYWDISTLQDTPLTQRMRFLILTVEPQLSKYKELMQVYSKTRDVFVYSNGYIQIHSMSIEKDFDKLCHETIRKLFSLVEIMKKLEAPKVTKLADHMMTWLKANWTNPFPNEVQLGEIAQACLSTPTVIQKWLVHARKYKWGPALQMAQAMKRPSSMLLEDSLNLMQGMPVRNLKKNHSDKLIYIE